MHCSNFAFNVAIHLSNKMENKFIISTQVDGKSIVDDTIITALEGGSNYWYWIKCDEFWFEVAKRYDRQLAQTEDPKRESYSPLSVRISNALLNVEGFEMNVYDLEDTDVRLGVLTLEGFKKGCQLCAQDYPHVWENLINEESDANDADILFQLAVLGEVVFG